MPTIGFEQHIAEVAARVEAGLEALLSERPEPGEIARPARLLAAMRHATLGGGKRLRPALLTAVARLFGAEGEEPLRAALAVECVHGYSLVHDDLPAMDDDDLRRGRPTVHRAFDEATAILAGDALQALAFATLADPATDPDPAVRAELVLVLARAAGPGGMAGGQMLDLAAEGRFREDGPERLGEAEVLRLQAMKTGALIEASAEMGAILGRAGGGDRAAIAAYARALGAAFQIADDLLDAEGAADAVGKATGKDAAAGKATLVGMLGVGGARARLDALTATALEALGRFGPEAEPLRGAARFVAAREH
ncbi:polyprenyl synthetase family protein [Hansschlegelia zhihuaiae]|uniref:Probable farnesyl diphosphate synthase n=1 Tax=Hansschlegelia zhihuaiae TaxID=405005 RepID=A0A4Q0M937_9HYPH|nr:farnesyl diphosphate synthase [Hansschlegelia zhihuaiae]RXF69585.1 polyprenyl synthetase family protein [Hansschlegelia zhihuaiae]